MVYYHVCYMTYLTYPKSVLYKSRNFWNTLTNKFEI